MTAIAGVEFDALTEEQVVVRVMEGLRIGRGGWIVTPNVDICRKVNRDPEARALVGRASIVVADGMPLVWASRLGGEPLPERVTGASLIFSLSAAAAADGRSVYLLGGEPGVPDKAAAELVSLSPALRVAGTEAPPPGFGLDWVRERLAAARPDIVFAGLGFPQQERVIAAVAPGLPGTWFVGCGAAIPFAAGVLRRAPEWIQQAGLEWAWRLASEPRRLFRRYLVQDLPFALRLLVTARTAAARATRRASRRTAGSSR
jgi:N-acetylglucosaminyldiphosphoundecaprenol N-acetyl-beta-D-mannosaminyltransferase